MAAGLAVLIAAWTPPPPQTIGEAVAAYERGETTIACAGFDALFIKTAADTDAWGRLLRYVGVCRYLRDDKPGATAAFDALLDAEPSARLSTDDFPPAVVDFFGRTKDRHAARVARTLAQGTALAAPPPKVHASPYTPFGAHQFARGDDGLGQFLLTGQAIGLAAGVGGLVAFESMKDDGAFLDYGRFRDPDAARLVHGIYLAGFATFAALWIYGAVDAARYTPALGATPNGAVIGGQGRW